MPHMLDSLKEFEKSQRALAKHLEPFLLRFCNGNYRAMLDHLAKELEPSMRLFASEGYQATVRDALSRFRLMQQPNGSGIAGWVLTQQSPMMSHPQNPSVSWGF
jgi:hypothetical protein